MCLKYFNHRSEINTFKFCASSSFSSDWSHRVVQFLFNFIHGIIISDYSSCTFSFEVSVLVSFNIANLCFIALILFHDCRHKFLCCQKALTIHTHTIAMIVRVSSFLSSLTSRMESRECGGLFWTARRLHDGFITNYSYTNKMVALIRDLIRVGLIGKVFDKAKHIPVIEEKSSR